MPQPDLSTIEGEVLSCREVHELPGQWQPEALKVLLAQLEIDSEGASDADLLDLVLMGLGDLEPDDAGIVVLQAVFGDSMGSGVRRNLAADLEEDRPWEDFADLSRQAGIFTATVLLQKAFPRNFGKPDATRAEVAFGLSTPAEAAALAGAPAAVILRALASGLGTRSIVSRIYAEGLRGGAFPEAEHILWLREMSIDPTEPRRVLGVFHGAQSFLGALADADPWLVNVKLRP